MKKLLIPNTPEYKEIVEFLREKLGLPHKFIRLDLTIFSNDPIRFVCEQYGYSQDSEVETEK